MTSSVSIMFHFYAQTNEYNAKVCELWDTLMGYEMRLVDQLEETINNFERNLADLIATFTEHIQGLYPLQPLVALISLFHLALYMFFRGCQSLNTDKIV